MTPIRSARTLPYWAALAVIFLVLDAALFRLFTFGADWALQWVAGRLTWTDPAKLYDFDFITALQTPLLGHVDARPFVNPPTTLLLVAPLALLPFWLSLAILSLASALCFALASRPFGADRLLLLLSPPVLLCMIAGQLSLVVAALATAAVARLRSREMTAGVLLGLAIAIKPTAFVLVPVALLCGKHWRALIAAGLTVAAMVTVSVAWLGIGPWSEWLLAVPRFQHLFLDQPTLLSSGITPYATAVRLGVNPGPALWLGALIAIPLTAFTFARTGDPCVRLVVLLGGALLIAPYALNYELALLAPAVLSQPLSSPKRLILPTLWSVSLCSGASLLGLLAIYSWAAARVLGLPGSPGDEGCVEAGIHVRA